MSLTISLLIVGIVGIASAFVIEPNNELAVAPINISEDGKLTTIDLIDKYGYVGEQHSVVTTDGYVLEMHRIVGKKNQTRKSGEKRPVVFLMHGLLCTSADWVYMGPEKSLGYLFSNENYDVWTGNARGNRYSRKHLTFDTHGKKFWQYSWHEIGVYDLPAMIDYVLETTGQQKLNYIGHSQGTTAFFVMTSTRPEYNEKVALMQALAPAAFVSHLKSPFLILTGSFVYDIEKVSKLFGLHEFLPHQLVLVEVAKLFCKDHNLFNVCLNVLFAISGSDPSEMDVEILPTFLGHVPAGAATRQILHYGQLFKSHRFCQYDFGKKQNKKVYGTPSPPDYQLSNITVPIVLHYGRNDWLTVPKDVEILAGKLPNLLETREVPWHKFNHLDFLVARNVRTLLYDNVVENVKKYTNQ